MFLQPYKSDFVLAIIKEVQAHEVKSHCTLMNNIEINNNNKNKYGKLKTILSIWSFKRKRSPYVILTKQKYRLYAYGVMQKWGVNY